MNDGIQILRGGFPSAIGISTDQLASRIPVNHSIWIHHRNYLKDNPFPEIGSRLAVPKECSDDPLH